MRRREFVGLVGGAAVTWPHVLQAQQTSRMRRVGMLLPYAVDDLVGQARGSRGGAASLRKQGCSHQGLPGGRAL